MFVEKGRIIALTLALYKVTAILPENEVLRHKIRETANDILADLICSNSKETEKRIDLLIAYFQVAIPQNWLDKKNFLVLEREYGALKQKINGFKKLEIREIEQKSVKIEQKKNNPKEKSKNIVSASNSRNKRQDKILELMQKQGKITLEQLKKELFQVCPRTLRRDINHLIEKNLIERIRKSKKDVLFVLNAKKDSGQSILE